MLVVVAVVEADTFCLFSFVVYLLNLGSMFGFPLCMPMSSGSGMGACYGFSRLWMGFGRIGAWLWGYYSA